MKRLIAGLLIACLTTACGWQLRGSSSVTPHLQSVYIDSADTHSALINNIRQILLANDVALENDSSAATLTLLVIEERHDRRTAAVGSDALTSAYELFLTLNYDIRTPAGKSVSTQNTAVITRTFNYSASGASSGAREEALLLSEMRRELAQTIVRRLSAVADTLVITPAGATDNGQTAP